MTKPKPVARCTKCGHYTNNVNLINQPCPIKYVGKKRKCQGIYRSMLLKDDWEKCPDCSGLDVINDNKCTVCQGTGWICIRK